MNTKPSEGFRLIQLKLAIDKRLFSVQDIFLFEDSPLGMHPDKESEQADSHKSKHKHLPLHPLTHDRRFRQAGFSEASGRVSRQHSGPAPAAHWTAPPQTQRTHSHGFTALWVGNSAVSDRGIWRNGAMIHGHIHSLSPPKSPLLFGATQRILPCKM